MNPTTTPLLEMKGISKRFPGVVALNNVSLEARPAEIVALMGENGAGKSTLMKILGGVHQPDEGRIRINGETVMINSVNDSMHLGIGFIHQELNVLPNLDVAANVFLGREPRFGGFLNLIDRRKIEGDTQKLLNRLGVDVSPRAQVGDLSIAQRQMIEIAKALSLNTRLLIMDEPTSSLTLAETNRLLEVVKDLRSQGVSVIYISHRLGEVTEIADRVVVLRDGANAGTLEREEINHDRIVQLMVGRDLQHVHAPKTDSIRPDYFVVEKLRTRRYPDNAVSFSVGRGEILGVAGLIGAGRTEVAQALFGVEPALGGRIALDGEKLKISSPQDAMSKGVCLIPEDRRNVGLITGWTVRENITLATLTSYANGGLIDFAAENRAAADISSKLRVKTPSVEAMVSQLSGGNQQKVVLAKWLLRKLKVIIFDEPTRGIDVGAKSEIYDLINQLAADGAAVIVISSDLEEILRISDRIAVMHEGALTGVLGRAEASEEAIMRLAVGHQRRER
ncbi:MAG TPA: sugar ABC transporter ATP-binding protein [Blastocatellia bacterium]|nr:sugar ABC transporter ATP-binding protein [Blastocatellia bacterium]